MGYVRYSSIKLNSLIIVSPNFLLEKVAWNKKKSSFRLQLAGYHKGVKRHKKALYDEPFEVKDVHKTLRNFRFLNPQRIGAFATF